MNLEEEKLGQKACFVCKACGAVITQEGAGSRHRNHCPRCLASVHLDEKPGDRASPCKGVMDAIGVWVRKDGEWAILHRCRKCGTIHSNRIAADDKTGFYCSKAAGVSAVSAGNAGANGSDRKWEEIKRAFKRSAHEDAKKASQMACLFCAEFGREGLFANI